MNARPLALLFVLLSVLGTAWWILQPEAGPVVSSKDGALSQAQSQEVAELDDENAEAEVEEAFECRAPEDEQEAAQQARVAAQKKLDSRVKSLADAKADGVKIETDANFTTIVQELRFQHGETIDTTIDKTTKEKPPGWLEKKMGGAGNYLSLAGPAN